MGIFPIVFWMICIHAGDDNRGHGGDHRDGRGAINRVSTGVRVDTMGVPVAGDLVVKHRWGKG